MKVFMSTLQEQAVQLIHGLSEENISFLIEFIQRFMVQNSTETVTDNKNDKKSMQAFLRLDAARAEIKNYLPKDFDPEKELEEAITERYENIH